MSKVISMKQLEKRLIAHRIIAFCLVVICIIFIFLFIEQTKTTTRQYMEIYDSSIKNAASITTIVSKDDFDYDTKYREITAEINVCCEMVYLVQTDSQKQKVINELYYALIKLPNQIKTNLVPISRALTLISQHNDEGYTQLKVIIDGLDKLDY